MLLWTNYLNKKVEYFNVMAKKDSECKECGELSKKYDELKKDYELTMNQLRILQADFDNYKKRASKEMNETGEKAVSEFIANLLPELDSFEKALKASNDEGFKMIYKNLLKAMEKNGLKEIKSVGEKFDINFHEALMAVNDTSKEDNIIIDEAEKGYIFKGKVVKPSKVIVNKKQ